MSRLDYIYRDGKKLFYGYTKQFVWVKNENEFKELLADPLAKRKVYQDIEQEIKRKSTPVAVISEKEMARRKKREYIQ